MKNLSTTIKAITCALFILTLSSLAHAQTRTWVSGVGDDLNPCSRTAPCKTFAGAISKTSANGEIDCIDSGGFGTVTITKSITIDGQGVMGSILAAGTNGVNVNDSATATPNTILVSLRNLSIQGAGTGLVGVNFTSGKSLHVENCIIMGFRSGNSTARHGISVALTVSASQQLTVKDTIIRDNSGSGIRTTSSGATGINVMLNNVRAERNQNGFRAETGTRAVVVNSEFSQNIGSGVEAANTGVTVDVATCVMENNTNAINLSAAGGTIRATDCVVTGNTTGVNLAGGTFVTYGDNRFAGNTNESLGGAIPAAIPKK
jgi:hypothetical protein